MTDKEVIALVVIFLPLTLGVFAFSISGAIEAVLSNLHLLPKAYADFLQIKNNNKRRNKNDY